jgi:curli biogenesis system outer membrane secretion channel CsgG
MKLLLFPLLILINVAYANTEIIKVEVVGSGESLQSAIDKGLTEAMGRVNGRSMESEVLSKNSESLDASNNSAEYLFSSEYQDQIKSKTRGVVESYQLISSNKSSKGLVTAKLQVSIVKFKPSKTLNRKRIAVLPLQTRSMCCKVGSANLNEDSIGDELTASISSYLVQSRKFTVFDRAYQAQVTSEQSRLSSENVSIKELAKLGQELIADYVLVGTINNITLREQTRELSTIDKKIVSITGNASVSYRIVDVATGQIKFSQTFDKDIRGSIRSLSDPVAASMEAVSIIANAIGIKILGAIYPFVVEAIEGDKLVIGTGGDLLEVGDRYQLIQYGQKIIDSYTKESLGRKETIIGMVEVTETTSKMSYAKILNNPAKDLNLIFKPKGFILRALSESDKKKNNITKQQELRIKIEESINENW